MLDDCSPLRSRRSTGGFARKHFLVHFYADAGGSWDIKISVLLARKIADDYLIKPWGMTALLDHEVRRADINLYRRHCVDRSVGIVGLKTDIICLRHRSDFLQLRNSTCVANIWLNQRDNLFLKQFDKSPLGVESFRPLQAGYSQLPQPSP